jgi:hypothetical protein
MYKTVSLRVLTKPRVNLGCGSGEDCDMGVPISRPSPRNGNKTALALSLNLCRFCIKCIFWQIALCGVLVDIQNMFTGRKLVMLQTV